MPGASSRHALEKDFGLLGNVLDMLVPGITAKRQGLFPRVEEEFKEESWDDCMASIRGRRRKQLSFEARILMPKGLRELVEGLGAAIEGEIRRLRYPRSTAILPTPPLDLLSASRPQLVRRWRLRMGRGSQAKRRSAASELVAWGYWPLADNLQACGVRNFLPSDLVATELSSRLDDELHALLVSIIARFADDEQPDIRRIAEDLAGRLEEAQDTSGDESDTDLHDLGPFPEVKDLLSAVTDTDELSQFLAERMV